MHAWDLLKHGKFLVDAVLESSLRRRSSHWTSPTALSSLMIGSSPSDSTGRPPENEALRERYQRLIERTPYYTEIVGGKRSSFDEDKDDPSYHAALEAIVQRERELRGGDDQPLNPGWRAHFDDLRRGAPSAGPLPTAGLIEVLVRDLMPALSELGWDLPSHLVAPFPSDQISAVAIPTPDGTLILINDGLINLMNKVGKWFFAHVSSRIDHSQKPPIVKWRFPEVDDHDDAVLQLLFTAYCGAPEQAVIAVRRPPRVPSVGGLGGFVHQCLLSGAEKFVIAHEYAHLQAGHFSAVVADPSHRRVASLRPAWDQEFEADELALGLLLASAPLGGSSAFARSLQACGPLMFFGVYDALRHLREAWAPQLGLTIRPDSHPPPGMRADRALAAVMARERRLEDVTRVYIFRQWLGEAIQRLEGMGPAGLQMSFGDELRQTGQHPALPEFDW